MLLFFIFYTTVYCHFLLVSRFSFSFISFVVYSFLLVSLYSYFLPSYLSLSHPPSLLSSRSVFLIFVPSFHSSFHEPVTFNGILLLLSSSLPPGVFCYCLPHLSYLYHAISFLLITPFLSLTLLFLVDIVDDFVYSILCYLFHYSLLLITSYVRKLFLVSSP